MSRKYVLLVASTCARATPAMAATAAIPVMSLRMAISSPIFVRSSLRRKAYTLSACADIYTSISGAGTILVRKCVFVYRHACRVVRRLPAPLWWTFVPTRSECRCTARRFRGGLFIYGRASHQMGPAPACCSVSKRFHDRQDHDPDEQQRRHLVEHAIPALAAPIAVGGEILQQREAGAVIRDQHHDQEEFQLQPAHQQVIGRGREQRDAKTDGEQRREGHDAKQLALHDLEARIAGGVIDRRGLRALYLGVIDEQARQI